MRRPTQIVATATAAACACAAALAPIAHAGTISQTFGPTGAEQTYVVPPGVTSVHVVAVGGSGGNGANSTGGLAASTTSDVAVAPAQTLYVEVGGSGGAGNLSATTVAGGFNGGASGADGAAGGGGASDVRTSSASTAGSLASRLVVAGGGGGAGAQGYGFEFGGAGGLPDGTAGVSSFGGGGGGGSTATSMGGAGGSGTYDGGSQPGQFGLGGAGGAALLSFCGELGGGGGGGGWYGGGGGGGVNNGFCAYGAAAGGGGGSSYGPSGTTFAAASAAGAGSVTISFDDTTPPLITPTVTGTLGTNGWYTSNVSLTWSVSELQSPLTLLTTGCTNQSITADQAATGYSCSASSAGGSATPVTVTIKRDATPPTVTYSGDAASYTVDQTVTIGCVAADALSGVASSTCAANSLSAVPAYTLGLGPHMLSASATDNAGNTGSGSAGFTVSVTPGSLCNLTVQLIDGSARYRALSAKQRASVDALAKAACKLVTSVAPKLSAGQKALLVAGYKLTVAALVPSGWLSAAQASTLSALAGSL